MKMKKAQLSPSICAAALFAAFLSPAANLDFPNIKEVIVTTKCHLDVGYTAPVPKLMRKYSTTDLDRAFALFEADKEKPADLRVRWTVPAWAMDVMLERTSPDRRGRLEEAIRQRRLMWHAYPFTIETEISGLEEMVRLFAYGSRLSRDFGFDLPRHAKQTDVLEHAWAMPTVLANAGVKFLHLGVNRGSKPDTEHAKIPPLCWWEGPDGSRILLQYCPNYGEFREGRLTVPKGWRHRTLLVYGMRGDNLGPMSPSEAAGMLSVVQKSLPGAKVRFGDPSEFAEAIIAEEKVRPTLPVIRGDMPDTWIHGAMTAPEATKLHRRSKGDLITLGVLDTMLRALGASTPPVAGELERGFRNGGLYSEHTWGFSGGGVRGPALFRDDWRKRYEAGAYKWFDDSFGYHEDYARRAYAVAQDGIKRRLGTLVRSVAAVGPRVVVFNPLPYKRDAEVEVEMPEGFALPGGVRDGGKVRFFAKGLPAGGYKTFAAKHEDRARRNPDAQERVPPVLNTRHFTAKFDLERGGIASLVEKATGRELVKQGGHALGQFLHERFSLDDVKRFVYAYARGSQRTMDFDFGKSGMPGPDKIPYAALTPKNWTATMKRTSLGAEVALAAGDTLGLAKGYELCFFFPDSTPCVDITWKVTGKVPSPVPEGGWICLPFNVASPSFRAGRLGGTIDPERDIVFSAGRNMMCIDRAITVRSGTDGAGVGVASADLPLWSLGKPGLWRYEPDYVPTEPEVFANLYNNQWNTNFRLWVGGSWTASLRVYPIADGANEEQAVFTPAWEIRQPCVAAFAEAGGTGVLPAEGSGVSVSRRGVRVTAFCPNPDGAGTVLRVWEQAGNAGEVTVTLPKGIEVDTVQPVNLRGEAAGEPVAVRDGRFSFYLGAWAPKSFVLPVADGQDAAAYRFYRFSVDLTAGDGMQISELKLFDATGDVTRMCAAVRYEAGTFNPRFTEQSPLKAVDGDLATKWYDDRTAADKRSAFGKDVWLVLEYAKPVAATRYEWHTADDTSRHIRRNPLAWRLQGSNDGKNWIDLDVVGCANPHTFDKTLAYSRRLDVPREPPDDAIVYPVQTSDGRRLVSYEVNGTEIHELAPGAR